MPIEFCPRCRTSHNMRVTVFLNTKFGKDGKSHLVSVRNFQCEECNSFVRSEELDADNGIKKLSRVILKRTNKILEKPKKRKGK